LELDERLPEAYSMIAVLRAGDYDWKGAEREFRRALALNPESWEVLVQYSFWYLLPMRRLDDALATWQKALELDPLSPFLLTRLAFGYYLTRQWDRAIEQVHKTLEIDPHYAMAYLIFALICVEAGKLDDVIRTAERIGELAGLDSAGLGIQSLAHARAGRTEEARKLLADSQELAHAKNQHIPPIAIALVYFELGEKDKGFDWLEKAVEERDGMILGLHAGPLFDPIRSDPRFHALLRKMNLEP